MSITAISTEEIFKNLERIIRDVKDLDNVEITNDSLLRNDLGAESIDFLDISFELESLYSIEVNFGDVYNYTKQIKNEDIDDLSINDIINYLINVLQ